MWTTRTKIGWAALLLGAIMMDVFAAQYFRFDSSRYFQPAIYQAKLVGLFVHITAMMVAIAVGPFQFLRSFRERNFALHRLLGKVYLVAAILGALGGLYLAPYSKYGIGTHVAFTLLGLGVLITTLSALIRIRRGDVQGHREWMTRSFALVFAAVMLRLYAPFLYGAFGERVGYSIVAWACWVPNLIFAEWLIRSRLRRQIEQPLSRPASAVL